jgi:hypothetical protein
MTTEQREKYIIGYNTDAELETIIQTIAQHNLPNVVTCLNIAEMVIEKNGEVGEEIENVCYMDIIKTYKIGILKGCTKAVLFDNAGDSEKTLGFLKKNGLKIDIYYKGHKKRLDWDAVWDSVSQEEINERIWGYLKDTEQDIKDFLKRQQLNNLK